MSQQAIVTLNSVVYNPAGASNGVLFWYDRSGGVAKSFSPLTTVFSTKVGQNQRTKVSVRLEVPVVATTDSTCGCAGSLLRTSSFQGEYWIDPAATAAERLDLFNRVKDLMASAMIGSSIKDLDPPFA